MCHRRSDHPRELSERVEPYQERSGFPRGSLSKTEMASAILTKLKRVAALTLSFCPSITEKMKYAIGFLYPPFKMGTT